jgi:hypothetical protein
MTGPQQGEWTGRRKALAVIGSPPTMKRFLASLTALTLLAAALAATAAGGGPTTIKTFKTPGAAVQCVLSSGFEPQASVLCITTLRPGVRSFPILPCTDFGDPGGGLAMSARRRATGICLSENPIAPPVKLLRYGHSISLGGISCRAVSKQVGIRCVNAVGHGFTMSPFGWRRF